MLSPVILIPAVLNGLMTGAVYALIALGLTLIYGVLHIINFAHGALLTAAMFAAFFAHRLFGLDPYIAALALTPLFFLLGYGLQRFIIGPAAHGEDRNILLVTLGLAAPVLAALFLADLALGLVNRVSPQIQVYFVGMPAKAALGVMVFLLATTGLVLALRGELAGAIDAIRRATRLL